MATQRLGAGASRDDDLVARLEVLSLARPFTPSGYIRSNLDRSNGFAAAGVNAPNTSGRLLLTLFPLVAGETIRSFTCVSGTTAGASLTHAWYCLYDINLAKLAVTTDDTSASWAINTAKTLSLSAPYSVTSTGLYYVGIVVVGTTLPTLLGVNTGLGAMSLPPIMNGLSTSGLTTPATAPATAAALSAAIAQPYVLAA